MEGSERAGNGAGEPPSPESVAEAERTVGQLVLDMSEQVSVLVREEIELAKVETWEKIGTLIRGSVAGVVAGVFALAALVLLMHAGALLVNDIFSFESVWPGYAIEALLFLGIGAAAGYFAYRAVSKGVPPVPKMAVEEAALTRKALTGGETTSSKSSVSDPGGSA